MINILGIKEILKKKKKKKKNKYQNTENFNLFIEIKISFLSENERK